MGFTTPVVMLVKVRANRVFRGRGAMYEIALAFRAQFAGAVDLARFVLVAKFGPGAKKYKIL